MAKVLKLSNEDLGNSMYHFAAGTVAGEVLSNHHLGCLMNTIDERSSRDSMDLHLDFH